MKISGVEEQFEEMARAIVARNDATNHQGAIELSEAIIRAQASSPSSLKIELDGSEFLAFLDAYEAI